MEAGRELDALVAEKVMGWHSRITPEIPTYPLIGPDRAVPPGETLTKDRGYKEIPHYSTDIAAAWDLLKHLDTQGVWVYNLSNACENSWSCTLCQRVGPGYSGLTYHQVWLVQTAPHAICLAALKAVGVEVEA